MRRDGARFDTLWPLFGLRLRTPRLELRLPTDDDLAQLAELAAAGVHAPEAMPFSFPWTRQPSPALERGLLQYHWRRRAEWRPDAWGLELAVVQDDRIVAAQGLMATSFGVRRAVSSGSWVGRAHQGRGIGTEMRTAVLHLAFEGLGAEYAHTEAWADNAASLGVTRRLGYVEDGWQVDDREGRPATMLRFRMERATWAAHHRTDVVIEGLEPCLELFGVSPAGR